MDKPRTAVWIFSKRLEYTNFRHLNRERWCSDLNLLTDKENVFCMAIADGKSQYEAYCIAYDTKTARRNTVDCNASKLMNKPAIRDRIAELRQRKEDTQIYSDINDKNKRIALIWERIEICRERQDDASIARYLDQLARLAGDYINVTKDISDSKPLSGVSDKDLQALFASMGTDSPPYQVRS